MSANQNLARLRVSKKINAGQHRAVRWQAVHGEKLVCVRYRDDPENLRRLVTLEIVVDERPLAEPAEALPAAGLIPLENPAEKVLVHVEFAEVELRRQMKAAGGRWIADRKAWRLTYAQAYALGLSDRIEKE